MIPHYRRWGAGRRRVFPGRAQGPDVPGATFALGSNGARQLVPGHSNDISTPEQIYQTAYHCTDMKYTGGGNHGIWVNTDSMHDNMTRCLIFGDEPLDDFWIKPYDQATGYMHVGQTIEAGATFNAIALASCANDASPEGSWKIETYGSNQKGQLGRPRLLDAKPHMDNATSIALVPRVVQIAGGVQHFVAVLETGDVIGWGNGRKGQLGEPVQPVVDRARVIEGIGFEVKRAACGQEFSVLVGDPAEGRIKVLGSDKFGIKTNCPQDVKGWKEIGAGWGTISVLFQDGMVKSWGRNDHGQLAPKGLPPIQKLAVGSEHSVALSEEGQVLVWGWGEHGNCGKEVDADGDVKDGWKVIPLPEHACDAEGQSRVNGVGAGYATSVFWTPSLGS